MADVGKPGPDPNTPKPGVVEGTGVTGVPAAPGTASEVAAQGFAGAKLQADGQATAGAKGGDVPAGGPAVSPYRDGKAVKVVVPAGAVATTVKTESRSPHVVKDAKFTAGGERFKAGETIYLTEEEAARWDKHLVSKADDKAKADETKA